jgi:hypothetical protein
VDGEAPSGVISAGSSEISKGGRFVSMGRPPFEMRDAPIETKRPPLEMRGAPFEIKRPPFDIRGDPEAW